MIDYIGSADNIGHHHFRFQLIQNGIGADPMAVFCEISAIKGKPIKRKQMLKFHLVCFPVLCWRGSFCIAESLGEVAGRRKAQNSCDLRERKVRLGQETLSFFYAAVDDIIDGRNTVFALKGVYHIIFGDADLFCQLVQRDPYNGGQCSALPLHTGGWQAGGSGSAQPKHWRCASAVQR